MFYLESFLGCYLIGMYSPMWSSLLEDVHLILYVVMGIAIGELLALITLSFFMILGILTYRGTTILRGIIKINTRRLIDSHRLDRLAWLFDRREVE